MAGDDFSLAVEAAANGTVVWVTGEVDIETAPQLDDCLKSLDGASVTVDFSGVTFMDSSGIAVLAGAAKRSGERVGVVVLRGVHPRERRVLEITGMDSVLKIEDA